jgi:hypothetical protein
MQAVLMTVAVLSSAVASATEAGDPAGIQLASTVEKRSASLLGGLTLDATWRPSTMAPLREMDALRFTSQIPRALDSGGGVGSDVRQVLALILGFVPGFGIGHLIAHDRDGFILFLIVDIALYALWGALGFGFTEGWIWGIGGVVWLVVHIIQALDAYSEAGGGHLVERTRELAVPIASSGGGLEPLPITTRVLQFEF